VVGQGDFTVSSKRIRAEHPGRTPHGDLTDSFVPATKEPFLSTEQPDAVYVDVETDQPQFATVKEGFIGRHLTFVPLGGIKVAPKALQVGVSKEQVKRAPSIEQHGEELSQADESALYHHYELNYTPPDTESGRRLARR
jgi:hypothetical protein